MLSHLLNLGLACSKFVKRLLIVFHLGIVHTAVHRGTLAGSSCEGATFQAAVLYKNVRPDISTKGNLFEFM